MARGSEDGVDRIAYGSGEVVSFEVTVFLHMPMTGSIIAGI